MHTSHPSAFISSTFIDLQEERSVVADALINRGLNVNALDVRPASTQSSKAEIISGIRESDFVILIIGDRYGSILPEMTGNKTTSITWWEYQRAMVFGKPVIAYFKYADESTHDDPSEQQYKLKRNRFEKFKSLVISKHNPAFFTDSYELSDKIDKSLINIYRSGVKSLTQKNSSLTSKVSELEAQLQRYKPNHQVSEVPSPYLGNPSNAPGGLMGLSDIPREAVGRNALLDLIDKKK